MDHLLHAVGRVVRDVTMWFTDLSTEVYLTAVLDLDCSALFAATRLRCVGVFAFTPVACVNVFSFASGVRTQGRDLNFDEMNKLQLSMSSTLINSTHHLQCHSEQP